MRSTNNSMSSLPLPNSVSVKQERISTDAKCKNPVNNQPVPPSQVPPPLPGMIDFAAVVQGAEPPAPILGTLFASMPKPIPVLASNGSGGTESGGAGTTSAFQSCKRRESHENPDARLSKVQCSHGGGYDMLDDTIQNVASAIGRERSKYKDELDRCQRVHREELAKKTARCAEEIKKIQADATEEITKARAASAEASIKAEEVLKEIETLKGRHSAEIDQQNLSFARELGKHKADAEAVHRQKIEDICKTHDHLVKNLELDLAKVKAELETTNRYGRDMMRKFGQELDEREARHRNHAMSELNKTYEKRTESLQRQFEAECRAQLAEQRTGYECRIAALETEVACLKSDIELRREVRKFCESFPPVLDNLYNTNSQLGVLNTRINDFNGKTVEIGNQANQLQGIMIALQSTAVQRPAPVMYYPPMHPIPHPHQPPSGRGRHAFQVEGGHAPPP
jgi:hypothetical protein